MFKLGSVVKWTSGAGGGFKTKMGTIVEVVAIGHRPDRQRFSRLYSGNGCGFGRNHESYVVQVKSRYYWPRVTLLSAAEKSEAAKTIA